MNTSLINDTLLNKILRSLQYRPGLIFKGIYQQDQLEFDYEGFNFWLTFDYAKQTITGTKPKFPIHDSFDAVFELSYNDFAEENEITNFNLTVFINKTISYKHSLTLEYYGYYVKGFRFYGNDIVLEYWFANSDQDCINKKHPENYFVKNQKHKDQIVALKELLFTSLIYTHNFASFDPKTNSYYPTLSFAQCYCESNKTDRILTQSKFYDTEFINPRINIEAVVVTAIADMSGLIMSAVNYKSMQVLFK
jgi:hypothetical protein